MDKKTMKMKLAYWAGVIRDSKSSGKTVSEWCLENEISIRKYYYWHKKVMRETYDMVVENGLLPASQSDSPDKKPVAVPEFAELPIQRNAAIPKGTDDSGIRIKYNDFTISIDHDFSERELAKVLQVMNHD